jgi:hypothetical protein
MRPTGSRGTCASAGAHLSREVRSRIIGHVAATEPTSAGRRGPEPWDMWQRQSLPQPGGEVQKHGTHRSAGAHLSQKARSRAIVHVAASEPTSTEKRGPEPYDT